MKVKEKTKTKLGGKQCTNNNCTSRCKRGSNYNHHHRHRHHHHQSLRKIRFEQNRLSIMDNHYDTLITNANTQIFDIYNIVSIDVTFYQFFGASQRHNLRAGQVKGGEKFKVSYRINRPSSTATHFIFDIFENLTPDQT
ncbi:hypothetical protein BLOT_012511 [Blomia tropicalis]|nr:hypothetical protein BLOT_012511 [Blomia tropicalis]